MQGKRETVILLFVSAVFLRAAIPFCIKSHQEPGPIISKSALDTERAQASIILKRTININAADRYTLTKLTGIGPKLADRIISYREKNEGFDSAQELMDVKGIGPVKYNALKEHIIVNDSKE